MSALNLDARILKTKPIFVEKSISFMRDKLTGDLFWQLKTAYSVFLMGSIAFGEQISNASMRRQSEGLKSDAQGTLFQVERDENSDKRPSRSREPAKYEKI